jgi:hypothetical protein
VIDDDTIPSHRASLARWRYIASPDGTVDPCLLEYFKN